MEKYIGACVSILYRKSVVYINQALRDYGITSAEQPFLFCLYENAGMTQEELSTHVSIDKGATARALGSLEEKGYVNREKDFYDKRTNRVFLTEKGENTKEEVLRRVRKWSRFLTAELTEEEQKHLFSAMDAMVEKAKDADLDKVMNWEEPWNKK